jgi:Rod binding domain-containing protein
MVLEPISNFLPPVSFPSAPQQTLPSAAVEQAETGRTRQIQETAKQFEGLLLQQVFKQMKEATSSLEVSEEEDGEESGFSEQIQSMFWMFLADHVSQEGGIGLWKQMAEQWSRRESANNAAKSAGLDEQI